MSAPRTKTTVNEPNATSAASRLFAADEAAAAADDTPTDGVSPCGATPEMDGGSTGNPAGAAGGVAGVVGIPAAGSTGGGGGRERLGFVRERGIPDAALRSMMTVP